MNNQPKTGYPSIDKPWLKYYSEEAINSQVPHMSAFEYLKALNQDNLDGPALRFLDKTVTYRTLIEHIDQTACALHTLGVHPGDVVVVYLPSMPREVYLFYALDKVGACVNYIIPGTPLQEICSLMNQFAAKEFFVYDQLPIDESYIYDNTEVTNIVKVSLVPCSMSDTREKDSRTITWTQFIEQATDSASYVRSETEPLFIAKTGGTTGSPKDVMLNDRSFNVIVHQYLHSSLNHDRGDKWLRLWPIFSATAAVASNHLPLCAGMELCLEPVLDLTRLPEIILSLKPHHIPMAPAILDVLLNSPLLDNQDLSFLKTIGCGGMAMTVEFEHKVQEFFDSYNIHTILGCGYGLTENASIATVRMNYETALVGSVGVPLVHTIVSAFEPYTVNELPYNTNGELCIASPSLMLGYYKKPELTHAVLKKHEDGKVWLHTGDIGYVDENGFVFVTDRLKRVIQTFPTDKVYPAKLEGLIESIPGVRSVSVVGAPDPEHKGFEVPVCFAVCYDDAERECLRMRITEKCLQSLPDYSIPKQIYFKDKFPLTKVGKVDYRALEQMAAERTK